MRLTVGTRPRKRPPAFGPPPLPRCKARLHASHTRPRPQPHELRRDARSRTRPQRRVRLIVRSVAPGCFTRAHTSRGDDNSWWHLCRLRIGRAIAAYETPRCASARTPCAVRPVPTCPHRPVLPRSRHHNQPPFFTLLHVSPFLFRHAFPITSPQKVSPFVNVRMYSSRLKRVQNDSSLSIARPNSTQPDRTAPQNYRSSPTPPPSCSVQRRHLSAPASFIVSPTDGY